MEELNEESASSGDLRNISQDGTTKKVKWRSIS